MWQPWRKIKTTNSKGFLLVQVGIVLVLLVLIITISLSHTTVLRLHMVHACTQQIAILTRYLQQKACASQKEQTLVFDERNARYRTDTREYTLPRGVLFGCSANTYGPPSSPQHLVGKAITFKNNTIHFSPDGSISAGTVYLTDAEKKITYALTIPVSSIAFLRLYRLDGAWVCLS